MAKVEKVKEPTKVVIKSEKTKVMEVAVDVAEKAIGEVIEELVGPRSIEPTGVVAEEMVKKGVIEETGEIIRREPIIDKKTKAEIAKKILGLKDVMKALDKKFVAEGDKSERKIVAVASSDTWYQVERIPSGVMAFDIATFGGIPKGRLTEFVGDESSSKTSMALRVIGQAQKQGLLCAYVDVEGTIDKKWAANFCDVDSLLLSQPVSGEEAMEIVDALIRSGSVDLIIVDSIAAMTPMTEIKKGFDEATMGVLAKLVNLAMRKWVSSQTYALRTFNNPVTILYIQQYRQKVGFVMGDPNIVPGGMAQRFAKSLSVKMWHGKTLMEKETDKPISIDMNFRVVKSKVCPSNMSGTYAMMIRDNEYLRSGDVNEVEALRKLCIKYNFIAKTGKNYEILKEVPGKEDTFLHCSKQEDIDTIFLKNPDVFELYKTEMMEFLIAL